MVLSLFAASRPDRSGRFRTGHAPAVAAEEARKIPAPAPGSTSSTGSTPRPSCSRAAASGACRACSSTCAASRRRSRAIRAAQRDTAQYETVSGGETGHAESVQVTFDPRKVTYGQLLQVYLLRGSGSDAVEPAGAG